MPRNSRCVEPGLYYHVTQRGVDGAPVFFSHADRLAYLCLAQANVEDCEIRAFAYCLMTNHVHWVVSAGRADSLAVFFRRVHGRYAQYLNARRDRTGHLWQNRFFSCPLGPTHLWRTLRYVELNPVRAGLVDKSADYKWSTAAVHLGGPDAEAGRLLDWNVWREAGGAQNWRSLLASGEEDYREIREIRACTFSGKPYGSDQFVREMEQRFQRHWRPVGRPKAVSASC
jgi:putative transposase